MSMDMMKYVSALISGKNGTLLTLSFHGYEQRNLEKKEHSLQYCSLKYCVMIVLCHGCHLFILPSNEYL